jgi:hypothetical protein
MPPTPPSTVMLALRNSWLSGRCGLPSCLDALCWSRVFLAWKLQRIRERLFRNSRSASCASPRLRKSQRVRTIRDPQHPAEAEAAKTSRATHKRVSEACSAAKGAQESERGRLRNREGSTKNAITERNDWKRYRTRSPALELRVRQLPHSPANDVALDCR